MRAHQGGGAGPREPHPELFERPAVEPYVPPNESQHMHLRPTDPDPGETRDTAIAISTFTSVLRDVVEGAFPPKLWVRGELSDFKRFKSGHCYFNLRDENAVVRCVIWRGDVWKLRGMPSDGITVVALCKVRVQPDRNEVQLTVLQLHEVGDGTWRKAFEQTRQRLDAEGLLAPARKRNLPLFPRRIAVITSPDGAVWHDIVSVVRARCPIVDLVLIPAMVQGEQAPQSLRRALARLTKWGGADLLIIGRGGGSREDLWAFNDEKLARRLAACPIPTISAVGHQVDTTICDLVADRCAPTPSAAAELAVPVLSDLRGHVDKHAHTLMRQLTRLTSRGNERLLALTQRLHMRALHAVETRRLRVEAYSRQLNALSPLATLGRGYAAVLSESGATISDVSAVEPGDSVRVRLRDGSFGARVESISPGGSQ